MKQISILFLFLSLSACSQTKTFKLSNNISKDIKQLLPEGSIEFAIMDKIKQSTRQNELTKKLQQSVAKNYDWFLDYSANATPGRPMPYHENFGLSEEEYIELQNLMNNIELESSGSVEYKIKYLTKELILTPIDTINFKTIKIDLDKNIINLDNLTLQFNDTIRVTDSNNGLKSKWFGYQWVYEYPENLNLKEMKNLNNLSIKQYKFTIGYLERTGKTYVQIKGREMISGSKTIDFEYPLVQE